MKKTWLGMTALGILLGFFSLVCIYFSWYPNVYQGVILEGVDVGGYDRGTVTALLAEWQKLYQKKSIPVRYEDTLTRIEASDIDFEIDPDATINEIWSYGRRGTWWERGKQLITAFREGYPLSLAVKYNKTKLDNMISQWKEKIDRPPRNAVIDLWTGKLVPHQLGYSVEEGTFKSLILEELKKKEPGELILPVKVIFPKITKENIADAGMQEILSTYTTTFNNEDRNRTENIKLAAVQTNGTVLDPGAVFSFNQIVGPREKEYGFKEALEIVDGEFVPGVGGGVCQVSSTLYNAVLLANLKIVERYNHSRPLSYVPLGRDATVAYGALDFKFVNNTEDPLLIMAEVEDNRLAVAIIGRHPLPGKVEIRHDDKKTIPPAIVRKEDDTLYLGETQVEQEGRPGYSLTTFRDTWSKGKLISREVVSKDVYLGEDTIIRVGKKVPPIADKTNSNNAN